MATKIGVYFDQSAIGGGLDVEGLVEGVEARHSDSCLVVKAFPVLAADEARKEIAADIEENELDGVLLCGSAARVDWDLYQFEDVQVERVSLREGCVKAYKNPDGSLLEEGLEPGDAPELLTLMAVDYINMGIIKLQKSNVPNPEIAESFRRILVLGGGWTGIHAALAASKAGMPVTLVEKEAELGGRAATFLKTIPLKAPHVEAQATGLEAKIEELKADANIQVLAKSSLKSLGGAPGQYMAAIETPGGEQTLEIGSVVLATGWVPQDGKVLAPLGYGTSPKIVTMADFEVLAKEGKINAKRVAFILDTKLCQCSCQTGEESGEAAAPATADVAASAPEGEGEEAPFVYQDMESPKHLNYSNAVNSVVALKQAGYVADQAPDCVAYILYDSMVVQGVHERFYKAAQDNPGIMLSKADVREVVEEGNQLLVRADNTLLGGSIELAVDLVVLPTGMVPTTAKDPIMEFQYRQGPAFPDLSLFDGFADSNYICFPYETRRTGVYAAGCVRQPMTLDAACDDAGGAVLKAIQCIESVNRGVAVHPRSGDLSYPVFNFVRCTQCKRCTEECPFGALDDDEKGTPKPNPTRCRRCGTCMGACPERVISFDNYNIDQIGSMIRDIKVPDNMDEGGPRVIILACENDAMPCFDMAAMRGMPWSPYVRIIPVRCLGSVNAIWVADAMSKGIDGVMLMGCKYGDDYQCHFVKGSEIANRRKDNIAETLERLGVEPERVVQYQVSIDDYNAVPGMVDDFMKMIFEKGPNPFKGY
ncbi:hydrogenase iron-sulfur subunit [Desulfovibrio sp. OttesenSCG-928-G11]|nr:hydrogenase iron-sulfur subunit [Desulfovibrio sp. OttesenSCG-928-G11]